VRNCIRSEAKNVDECIDELDVERKHAVIQLRQLTRQIFPEFREFMKYGVHTYENDGKVFAFASKKHYVSIYVNNIALPRKYKEKLGNAKLGTNYIRYYRCLKSNLRLSNK
jgi:uncharacterized protein YdhG (YjbR/CyaY superfamily)